MQNTVYADRVRNFDWAAMFSRLDGATFVRSFGKACRDAYDFTLIDSRTGIADSAGIATILLPDRVVLCFTPNRQSVLGVRAIGDSILRARPKQRLLPVVTRVEKGVEGWREAQLFYRTQLDGLLPSEANPEIRVAYWGAAEIVHYPNYALGELLATFSDSPVEQNSLLSDMRRLVSRIVESEFMSSREGFPAPEFSEEARRHYARRIRFRDPRSAGLREVLEGDPSSGLTVLLSWAAEALREADFDPDWLEQLGSGLGTLAGRLGDAGDGAGALAAIREAVDLYRRLATANPARFEPDLASSLNNMSNRLSDTGHRSAALAAIREAVDIRCHLAIANAPRFEADLALSLNNLAGRLSETGDRAGTFAAIREAVDGYRRLAQENPARFVPDLALSLNNLSLCLHDAGDWAGALTAIREAVEIRRRLAQDNPARFASDLARSVRLLERLEKSG